MGKISEFFGNPGFRTDVHLKASIPYASDSLNEVDSSDSSDTSECKSLTEVEIDRSSSSDSIKVGKFNVAENGEITTSIGFTGLKKNKTDVVLDWLVEVAGSQIMFFIMMVILIGWAIVGIVLSAPFDWQVVMQDGQSIQCYIWDTLLMRQQLMSAHEHMYICAELGSRITGFKKLLVNITKESKGENVDANDHLPQFVELNADLQDKTWYDRLATCVSKILGSWYTIILFWCGIFVWIGCGALVIDAGNSPPYTGVTSGDNPQKTKFGNMWQMYINTATGVLLYLSTVFLQNIRARHDIFVARVINELFVMDVKIDRLLRDYCNDYKTEADIVTVKAQKRTKGEVVIDWYGDIIGTGVGVFIGCLVFTVWIIVGHPMNWNDNWWLLIGTYTGLVGFLDGFVIRQNYFRNVNSEEENYEKVIAQDFELYSILGIECPESLIHVPSTTNKSITYRASVAVNKICSHRYSVLASIVFIIALICIASGLRWSETGQLLANTPTMIIEAFFLLILLQAHNWADITRRAEIALLYNRRMFLLEYLGNRFGHAKVKTDNLT